MGVIKKVYHRDDHALTPPRHSRLFLDMEENIHIHYRDLRIELSRKEFEEFTAAFSSQSEELLGIIKEKNYEDGLLPNANQEDVRIWTESLLETDVKYHPQRISLEDCGDGYHFHYRQYKILLTEEDFHEVANIFKQIDLSQGYPDDYDSILSLIIDNDVDYTLGSDSDNASTLSLHVASYHVPKVKNIFTHIGFPALNTKTYPLEYGNDKLKVIVHMDKKKKPADYRLARNYSTTTRLLDYLRSNKNTLTPDETNTIKATILNQYYSLKSGSANNFNINPETWLYIPSIGEVIFPHADTMSDIKKAANEMYWFWNNVVKDLGLSFVKPKKLTYNKAGQDQVKQQIEDAIINNIATVPAVSKIWVMGSMVRKQLGEYSAPFVHGKLVKLGSDVDILIEINPDEENNLPEDWHLYIKQASNGCAIYHLEQIPMLNGIERFSDKYPHLEFIHHLIDAYVHLPSLSSKEQTAEFLNKFNAQLFYDRERDGVILNNEQKIAAQLEDNYNMEGPSVKKLAVTSDNDIYEVSTPGGQYILKLLKVSGNYSSDKIKAHADYETAIINNAVANGVKTARVIATRSGETVFINDCPALLFDYIAGNVLKKPPYDIGGMAAALASFHNVQKRAAIDENTEFDFRHTADMWLNYYNEKCRETNLPEIVPYIPAINAIYAGLKGDEIFHKLLTLSESLHNHGDVAPKNFITTDDQEKVLFDFNNAFYGPKIADVLDGAFEVALSEKYMDLIDFSRFHEFIAAYRQHSQLAEFEVENMNHWINFIGIIKFAKEVRAIKGKSSRKLRVARARGIAEFLKNNV